MSHPTLAERGSVRGTGGPHSGTGAPVFGLREPLPRIVGVVFGAHGAVSGTGREALPGKHDQRTQGVALGLRNAALQAAKPTNRNAFVTASRAVSPEPRVKPWVPRHAGAGGVGSPPALSIYSGFQTGTRPGVQGAPAASSRSSIFFKSTSTSVRSLSSTGPSCSAARR